MHLGHSGNLVIQSHFLSRFIASIFVEQTQIELIISKKIFEKSTVE